ncbi:hypothetical protein ACMFMG_005179 [Clarireedia jacksonii]
MAIFRALILRFFSKRSGTLNTPLHHELINCIPAVIDSSDTNVDESAPNSASKKPTTGPKMIVSSRRMMFATWHVSASINLTKWYVPTMRGFQLLSLHPSLWSSCLFIM